MSEIKSSTGVALLMAPGCGKSLSAISIANILKADKILVLAPVSVVGVWAREFNKWSKREYNVVPLRRTGRFKTPLTNKGKARMAAKAIAKAERFELDPTPTVVVTNYESAWRDALSEELLGTHWDLVILDECHKIKNPGSNVSKFCHSLQDYSDYRIGLTGTEMPHGPLDVFSQFFFVNKSVFGTNFSAFKHRYARMNSYDKAIEYLNQDELKKRIDSVSYRATEEVLDLPDVQHITIDTPIEGEARSIYDNVMSGMWAELDSSDGSEAVIARIVAARLMRCSQVTGGHIGGVIDLEDALIEQEPKVRRISGTSKGEALKDILDGLPIEEKVVVFCRFREDLNQVREIATSTGREYKEISGQSKDGLTDESEMNPEADVVGVQIQSGGVGIDLTAARYGIYWNKDFSYGNYEQSLARMHRPGQERPVIYYHFVTPDGSIDERIEESLASKESVVDWFKKEARDRQRIAALKLKSD